MALARRMSGHRVDGWAEPMVGRMSVGLGSGLNNSSRMKHRVCLSFESINFCQRLKRFPKTSPGLVNYHQSRWIDQPFDRSRQVVDVLQSWYGDFCHVGGELVWLGPNWRFVWQGMELLYLSQQAKGL